MKNTICLDLLVLVLFISLFPSSAQAFYKKKVMVEQIKNPSGWDKPYHPGNIILELLSQELMHRDNVQLISKHEKMQKLMDDGNSSAYDNFIEPAKYYLNKENIPRVLLIENEDHQMMKQPQNMDRMMSMNDDPLWPSNLGKKVHKSTFTKIRGKIIKFIPDNSVGDTTFSMNSENREIAEVEVHIEMVHNSTGRVLHEKTFRKTSRLGTQPFSIDRMNFADLKERSELSSMNIALNSLKRAVGEFISEKLVYLPLEGEIIATKIKKFEKKKDDKSLIEEEILINIGSSNGVRIGDLFQVDAVGLGLSDPYTAADLGDVYVKIGVIQILQVWGGTAKAMPLAGKNFEKGFLVRSVKKSGRGRISSVSNKTVRQEEEKVPWWEFHGIKAVN